VPFTTDFAILNLEYWGGHVSSWILKVQWHRQNPAETAEIPANCMCPAHKSKPHSPHHTKMQVLPTFPLSCSFSLSLPTHPCPLPQQLRLLFKKNSVLPYTLTEDWLFSDKSYE
jgi:hypothetical protein